MFDYDRKKAIKGHFTLGRAVLTCFLVAVIAWLGYSNFNAFKKTVISFRDLKKSENGLDKLGIKEENLAGSLASLKTEEGLEKEIREKFPVAKNGEEMVVFVNEEKIPADNLDLTEESWWDKLIQRLGF